MLLPLYPLFSIPACFSQKLGTHSLLSIPRVRHAAAASMPLSSTTAASHLPHENGDKVTLRNCFPQADERELFPTREPRVSLGSSHPSPPYPLFRLLNPTRSRLVPSYFAISSCCFPNVPLSSRARSRPVLLREMSISARRRVEDLREVDAWKILRNRYFVTGEITTCVIRSLSVSSRGF